MKKTKNIALVTLALATIGFASCKKARTCTCTSTQTTVTTQSGTINSNTTTTSAPFSNTETLASATKKTAKGKKTCNSRTEKEFDTATSGGTTTKNEYSTVFDCTIK